MVNDHNAMNFKCRYKFQAINNTQGHKGFQVPVVNFNEYVMNLSS